MVTKLAEELPMRVGADEENDRIWLSPGVMMDPCRWLVLMVTDGYERWFADGHRERCRSCRSSRGGVPIGCGR